MCGGVLMDTMSVNGKAFAVIKLLGKGKGGYSYLVTDGENQYVLKQIHHEPCSYYTFGNKIQSELNDYERLKNAGLRLPKLIDCDVENERILKDYIDGKTAYELVLQDEMKPEYIEQIREMCRLLNPKGINIDYFPTNFILNNGLLWYIDYECNDYMEEWNFENWGIKYWSKTKEFCEYHENNK
jgi:TP53 regulating kinase-like protein